MLQFLPMNREDMKERDWEQLDFVIITGDAYVDHSSFGAAIIGRLLENEGFKVGVISQPSWQNTKDFKKLGRPRLAFLITGGNIDSMVNHYTVAKRRRKNDAYSPGGKMGLRPDRATIVYGNRVKEAYSDVPIILGGIEASLRRLAHYDYWDDKVRRSILLDSKADLLVYGMGENQIIDIAHGLDNGIDIHYLNFIRGTVYKTKTIDHIYDGTILPSYDEIIESKKKYAESFMNQHNNMDAVWGKTLIEPYRDVYIVENPPARPLEQSELDRTYSLQYMRNYHPTYEEAGGVPAIEEVKFSIISNRGCFGSCSFCALTFHQGRVVQARSHISIMTEAEKIVWEPGFKGYIHDVGGPTANFRHRACEKQIKYGVCKNKQCLFPNPCNQLNIDHKDYLSLLRKLRQLPNVKKVFIRSGIRYDYLIHDKDEEFFNELCEHHISGQLKVAPEHISPNVLEKMGKPRREVYEKFVAKYKKINQNLGLNQFIVPYLMSSHPGSTLKEAVELAEYLRDLGYMPEQVQDFYPTPGTLSTCMYYTGLDPRTMKEVYVPKNPHEKAMQRALIQYRNPKNYDLVHEALIKAGRTDLIGFGGRCLIWPKKKENEGKNNRFKGSLNKANRGYKNDKFSKSNKDSNNRDNKGKERKLSLESNKINQSKNSIKSRKKK
ncbi:YgiQ family radical SAM protein [Proteiniborus sp. MB09-C3]|uniref:YgiQ family radical SAM protein n=1 Tax=Proteiniborus sp. MB09-C3 TaxID=3050072 RepID=UPI002555F7CC|nr:YgiQ family radical SAM protein [Proteiniborus sp. MB09-C3]WIV11766.1 YgiQ family radical SAM protein [Proteiniborus sp. MB09-C3]